jgi:hypothetical protein
MKIKVLILFITLLSQNIFAESKIDFENLIKPKRLESIDWYNIDAFDVYHKALGKETSRNGNNYYYEVNKIKYPISIHKKEKSDRIQKIYFRLIGKEIVYNQLQKYLNENGYQKEKSKPEQEYQYFINTKKKIKLKFSNISLSLYSVEKWY